MEVVDKIEVFSRLDKLRTAVFGDPILVLPDTFLLKFDRHTFRFGNGYVLRHRNLKDLVVIDAVRPEHQATLERYKRDGFTVRAILITHKDLLAQSYKPISKLARELDTNYYIHPLDSNGSDSALDITAYDDVFKDFDLSVFHTPGHTGGSVLIYCGINRALFTGDSAIGSSYSKDDYFFERPPMASAQSDLALREGWESLSVDFEHLLPLHGKPQFDITAGQRENILRNLTKNQATINL